MKARPRQFVPASGAEASSAGILVTQVSVGALLWIALHTSSKRTGMCVSSAPVASWMALASAGATEIMGCSPTPRAPKGPSSCGVSTAMHSISSGRSLDVRILLSVSDGLSKWPWAS